MGNGVVSKLSSDLEITPVDDKHHVILFNFSNEENVDIGLRYFDHSELINEKINLYMKGTRLWMIEDISNWLCDNNSKVFVLFGAGGTGKSVISVKVVRKILFPIYIQLNITNELIQKYYRIR